MTKTQSSFSAPPQVLTFDGLLSDFDGTIVDSTDGKTMLLYTCATIPRTKLITTAIVKHWHK
jgi:hypothetical protein